MKKIISTAAILFGCIPAFGSPGVDNPFPKVCPVELQPSACVGQGQASAAISSGDDPNGKAVPSRGLTQASQGYRTTHNLKVGREYEVTWAAPPQTSSLHMKFDAGDMPPGHQIEVNDGNGWRPGNRLDNTRANTPGNPANPDLLDLSQVTMKMRVCRAGAPAGLVAGPLVTKPTMIIKPRQGITAWGMFAYDSNDQDSAPDTKEPNARLNFSLGYDEQNGRAVSAGFLDVDVPLLAFGIMSLDHVGFVGMEDKDGNRQLTPNVEIIETALRKQYKAPDIFVDVHTTNTVLTLDFYDPANAGSLIGAVYFPTGSPLYSWKLTMLGAGDGYDKGVSIAVTEGGVTGVATELRAKRNDTGNPVNPIQGLLTETQTVAGDKKSTCRSEVQFSLNGWGGALSGTQWRRIVTTKRYDNNILLGEQENLYYLSNRAGEVLWTKRVRHTGNGNDPSEWLETNYRYHLAVVPVLNSPGVDPDVYGKLQYQTNPDGSWEYHDYFHNFNSQTGEVTDKGVSVYRPYKSLLAFPLQATSQPQNCVVTHYREENDPAFTPPAGGPATNMDIVTSDFPGSVETYTAGVLTGKTTREYSASTYDGHPAVSTTVRHYRNATDYEETVAIMYERSAPAHLVGKLARKTMPDGTVESHAYEIGTFNETTGVFTPLATGTWQRHTVTNGTAALPDGTANETTRKTIIRSPGGVSVREEVAVYTGSGYSTATVTTRRQDGDLRLLEEKKDGRITQSNVYNGLAVTKTDERGVEVTSTSRTDGRMASVAKAGGETLTYGYNGLTTTETRTGGGFTLSSSTSLDLASRIISETDEAGAVTQTAYPNGGLEIETTYPGGLKTKRKRHLDGTVEHDINVTGTREINRYYNHFLTGSNPSTTIYYGTNNSSRYETQTRDWRDRILTEVKPSPTGSGTVTTTFTYDDAGRVTRETSSTGLPDILTVYDSLGRIYRRGVDVDGNGTLDPASTDRITEYLYGYEQIGGYWYATEKTRVYQADNNATATEALYVARRLHGNAADGTTAHTIRREADGVEVHTRKTIDRANKTETVTTTRADSSESAVNATVNGLLASSKPGVPSDATTYQYDGLDRLEKTVSPVDGTSTNIYNASGQLETTRNDNNKTVVRTYYPSTHANAGEVKSIQDEAGHVRYFEYDDAGRQTRQWGAAVEPEQREYTVYGELHQLHTYRGGSGWDNSTWPGTPGTADTTEWAYDNGSGVLLTKTDASGEEVEYSYFDHGGLHTRTTAENIVTTHSYTALGERQNTTYSDGTHTVSRSYDRLGRLKTRTDASGTQTYTYRDDSQLDLITSTGSGVYAGYTFDPQYDGFGRINKYQIKRNGGAAIVDTAFGYDAPGRMDAITAENITHTRQFSATRGLFVQGTWAKNGAASIHYTQAYDNLGRTTVLGWQSSGHNDGLHHHGAMSYTYNDRNKRTTATLLDNSKWVYQYDNRGRIDTANRFHADGTTVYNGSSYDFDFDNAGNRTAKKEGGTASNPAKDTHGYTPNNLNQYTAVTHPGVFHLLGRAPAGAAVTVNGNAAPRQGEYFHVPVTASNTNPVWQPVNITAGAASQSGSLAIPRQSATPQYDLDGNLTNDELWSFEYDAENRLTSATRNVAGMPYRKLEYLYDDTGRRIQRLVYHASGAPPVKTEIFLYHGWNCVAVVDATHSVQKTQVWGPDYRGSITGAGGAGGVGGLLWVTDKTTSESYVTCQDGNGNIVQLIDIATTTIAARYEYSPFGSVIRATGARASWNRFRFCSKWQDSETDFSDFGLRWYRADWGRWINRDPIAENGGANLYGYVLNDPINAWDYLGMYSELDRLQDRVGLQRARLKRIYKKLADIGRRAQDGGGCISAEEAEALQAELRRLYSNYLRGSADVARDAAQRANSGLIGNGRAMDISNDASGLPVLAGGLLPSREDLEYAGEQAAIASQELAALSNRIDNTYTTVRAIEVGGTVITTATGVGGGIKLLATEGLKQGGKIIGKQLAKGALAAGAVVGAAEGVHRLGMELGLSPQEAEWARAGVYALANAIGGAKAIRDARSVSKGFNGKGCNSSESGMQANARAGAERETYVQGKLEGKFKNASVQREQYLRNADGTIAKDPLTGTGRRIDHAVIQDGQARYIVETTSKTADKSAQLAKEARIRANGGKYIRDRNTRKLIDVSGTPTRLSRRR